MKDLVIGLSLLGMVSACSPAPQAKDNVEEDYCQYVNLYRECGQRTHVSGCLCTVRTDTGKPRIRSWLLEILFGI